MIKLLLLAVVVATVAAQDPTGNPLRDVQIGAEAIHQMYEATFDNVRFYTSDILNEQNNELLNVALDTISSWGTAVSVIVGEEEASVVSCGCASCGCNSANNNEGAAGGCTSCSSCNGATTGCSTCGCGAAQEPNTGCTTCSGCSGCSACNGGAAELINGGCGCGCNAGGCTSCSGGCTGTAGDCGCAGGCNTGSQGCSACTGGCSSCSSGTCTGCTSCNGSPVNGEVPTGCTGGCAGGCGCGCNVIAPIELENETPTDEKEETDEQEEKEVVDKEIIDKDSETEVAEVVKETPTVPIPVEQMILKRMATFNTPAIGEQVRSCIETVHSLLSNRQQAILEEIELGRYRSTALQLKTIGGLADFNLLVDFAEYYDTMTPLIWEYYNTLTNEIDPKLEILVGELEYNREMLTTQLRGCLQDVGKRNHLN